MLIPAECSAVSSQVGAWQALVRARVPGAVVTDFQLAQNPAAVAAAVPVLVAPAPAYTCNATEAALAAFAAAGGTVVRVNATEPAEADPFASYAERPQAGSALAAAVEAAAGGPPPVQLLPRGATNLSRAATHVHMVAHARRSAA